MKGKLRNVLRSEINQNNISEKMEPFQNIRILITVKIATIDLKKAKIDKANWQLGSFSKG